MKKYLSNYKINQNSSRDAISQYFIDITYKCRPKSYYRYKLVVIIGYDILFCKAVLCCFALILDELTTTFNFLFYILNKYYQFNPHIITCDFETSLRKSLKIIFPNMRIFPCYYHYVKNIRKNILLNFNYNKENKDIFYNILAIIEYYLL